MNRLLALSVDVTTRSAGRRRRKRAGLAGPVALLLCALALGVFGQ